jgi:acylphosphatase
MVRLDFASSQYRAPSRLGRPQFHPQAAFPRRRVIGLVLTAAVAWGLARRPLHSLATPDQTCSSPVGVYDAEGDSRCGMYLKGVKFEIFGRVRVLPEFSEFQRFDLVLFITLDLLSSARTALGVPSCSWSITEKNRIQVFLLSTHNRVFGACFCGHAQVQGVFFRKSTVDKALSLGLVGWVMNTHEGTVKGEAQGAAAAVDALKVGPSIRSQSKTSGEGLVLFGKQNRVRRPCA